ncbi:MAG: polysaccharide deacetylase family protein [Alphaproteobacteria bacterium]|nr:polysaccharide deacetylase family protein [Alphaproteobacteria bacterium]
MTGVDVVVPTSSQAGPWAALTAELDAWAAEGRSATFWWRDDDATQSGERLSRLLDAAGATSLTLAVIPVPVRGDLAATLEDHRAAGGRVLVVQHGYAHVNHAPPTEKAAEYGPHRSADVMVAELSEGCETLESLFGDIFRPILTPPWNRIAPALVSRLGEAGLVGISAFGARPPGAGSTITNTHVDIIDWPGSRGFVGEEAALNAAVSHLFARRTGAADGDEPTGLLTHHKDHDDACWRFVNRFAATIASHPASLWTGGPAAAAGSRR